MVNEFFTDGSQMSHEQFVMAQCSPSKTLCQLTSICRETPSCNYVYKSLLKVNELIGKKKQLNSLLDFETFALLKCHHNKIIRFENCRNKNCRSPQQVTATTLQSLVEMSNNGDGHSPLPPVSRVISLTLLSLAPAVLLLKFCCFTTAFDGP